MLSRENIYVWLGCTKKRSPGLRTVLYWRPVVNLFGSDPSLIFTDICHFILLTSTTVVCFTGTSIWFTLKQYFCPKFILYSIHYSILTSTGVLFQSRKTNTYFGLSTICSFDGPLKVPQPCQHLIWMRSLKVYAIKV